MSSGRPTEQPGFDQPSGLLPTEPPARAVRWTGWLLLALALAALIFAVSFRLPDVVVAPFVIVPIEGSAPIQAPVAGLLANVHVQAGQRVKAGDELFVLRSDALRDADARLRVLHEDQRALVEQVAKRERALSAELAANDAQIALGERELGFRQQHFAATRSILERKQQAVAKGLLPQLTAQSDQLALAESETARVLAQQQLQQVKLRRQQQIEQRSGEQTEEVASAEKQRLQIAALTMQLKTSVGDLQSIRAPYDAVVLSVATQTTGSVIPLGAELCQLARLDAAAQARLVLPEAQMQRLRIGQNARLFLTAYPYQRYGAVQSEIAWISPAPVSDAAISNAAISNATVNNASVNKAGTPGFVAFASLKPNSANLPIRAGMTGEARVLVGRRTLLELALEPIRGLKERL